MRLHNYQLIQLITSYDSSYILQISDKCKFDKDATMITTLITDCGTTAEVIGDNIVYKNEVRFPNMSTALKKLF